MPCHAPHKNQRQVLPLPLLHGLFGRVPVGIAQGIVIDLICWLRQQWRRWRHAPCWKFIAAFRHAFYDNFIFTFIGIDIFLIVATNKTKNHFRCNVATFLCSPPSFTGNGIPGIPSTVHWKPPVLNCPWPLLSSPVLSCPVLELVSINASFAFARIHSHSHKQEEQRKKNPPNAFECH